MTSPSEKLHSFSMRRRQAEVLEVGDVVVDAAGDQRQPAALLEQADAEAALVLADDVGEVDAAFLVEDLAVLGARAAGSSSRSMSSWVSGRMSMRRMSPLRRIIGGWPTFRCKSDASCFMTMRKSLLTSGSRAFAALRRQFVLVLVGNVGRRHRRTSTSV